MQNMIQEATRITPLTKTLIDVIATNKPELVRATGVLPLGITDHSLVYATIRLKQKRLPPVVITVRNFKQFNTENFKADMERTPFYIASVFDDMDDILWAWNQLFRGVCDSHAVLKEIKVTVTDTQDQMQILNVSKAFGHDMISPKILKVSWDILSFSLTKKPYCSH